jgi:hypothetical protein
MEVFVIFDIDGKVIASIPSKDVPKRLPDNFTLKKKKGAPPSLFLFKTEEKSAKQSIWISDWKELPMNEKHWVSSGLSIQRMPYHTSEEAEHIRRCFEEHRSSRFARSQLFLSLSQSNQDIFAEFPALVQIELLGVSNKMKKQFMMPGFGLSHLQKYAVHITTQKERRMKESEEKRERDYLAIQKEMQMRRALSDEIFDGEDSTGKAFFVGEGLQYEVIHERSISDAFFCDLFDLKFAEDQIAAPLNVEIREKISSGDRVRTKRLTDGIDQNRFIFNRHILHRIWFAYLIRFIRAARACQNKYATDGILRGSWYFEIKNGKFV